MIPPEVLFQEIDGDVVLLSTTTGNYYGMNQVASRMWNLILQNGSPEAAVGVLLEEYDVDEAQLIEYISKFVQSLLTAGLLFEEENL